MRAVWLLMLLAGIAHAETPPADLPPADAVARALAAQPSVRAAQAEVRVAEAAHVRLRAGEHEYAVNLSAQRRQVDAGRDVNEWSLGVERPWRLPGKADLDDRIGATGVDAARERAADARHEAARQLLEHWYDVRRADLTTVLWQRQVEGLRTARRAVETRAKRGDAAHLEVLQAEAALAEAEAASTASEAHAQAARRRLAARFPELPEPAPAEATPSAPEDPVAVWLGRVVDAHHELRAAARELDHARLMAERAESERRPDPSLGLFLASEQGGDERVLGLTVSLPLPGPARAAQARGQAAVAEARAEMLAATQRRVAAELEAVWHEAASGVARWQRQADAAHAVVRQAELATRAHALGEYGLTETLLARRAALDATLAAEHARLDANQALARLWLDGHRLWPLDGESH
ncbi:MAG: TolC family protein [Pseudomonadota bacterium]